MYRPPDVDNGRDFSQYYRGSYIGLREPGNSDVTPALVSRVTDDGGAVSLTLLRLVERSLAGNTYRGERMDIAFHQLLGIAQFGMPQYGTAIYGPTVSYLSRNAPRNGHRGLRLDHLAQHTVCGWELDQAGIKATDQWINDVAWYTFNPTHFPASEAFKMIHIDGDRLACPLSRHFYAYANQNFAYPLIGYRQNTIGRFMETGDGPYILLNDGFEEYAPLLSRISDLKVRTYHDGYK